MKVKNIDMEASSPIVILNKKDAEELGLNPLDRIEIDTSDNHLVGVVDITDKMVEEGEIGVSGGIEEIEGLVDVTLASRPKSVEHIRSKLDDKELSEKDFYEIVEDIYYNRLSDVELGGYVSGTYTNGLSLEETVYLTKAMTDIGDIITWNDEIIADKHSIGGVAGNRVTPITVPIVAAAGIKIPKTSSRAITSPAGTADTMEVFCDVDFSIEKIKEIVNEKNGCLVWGGSVKLSPVDDQIIRAENPLSVDPKGQVIASVLSKKKSAGSNRVLIDIPYGESSKVENIAEARDIAERFKKVGSELDIKIKCTITRGHEPIGKGIGPVLEAIDILKVLKNNGPSDLKVKSAKLAEIILDMCNSKKNAIDILESGKALEKFREIIEAQNGSPKIEAKDLQPGKHKTKIRSCRSGIVTHINNNLISKIARHAGAPKDKGAGIKLKKKVNDKVNENEELFTIFAENNTKLKNAERITDGCEAVRVRGEKESLVEQI
ncbi:MAG: Thymidine phosphorylase/AMP phosphorylase DeoA [Candidatus Methanohalarchaeum thermophilum]|uniref:AMP phosphorylase n=1 Tax=Methanohalarchaeum thermophilum TaxID=1903181 RepID=A0A1Q6DS31_METT1|nr:MAG: Thymidine phosphorylase/AMP phosphorylase DeoA [Candidatus Methanohalarchaeum thermophilum]